MKDFEVTELFSQGVRSLETYIMFQIKQQTIALTPELKAKDRAPISLSMGAPVAAPPEFVINKLKECLDEKGIHSYSTPKGEPFFLEAVAKRMKNRFGVDVDPKTEVFSLIGSKEGLSAIFRGLINPKSEEFEKDIILIPDPGYASYKEQIKVSGGKAYSLSLTFENKFMPNLDDAVVSLEKEGYKASNIKALVINYPNNPLGATATREYFEQAVKFCKERKILLISDAAYADMFFGDAEAPLSILEIEGAKDVAIEFHSFSKPYAMTGWRVGWVCGNATAISWFGKLKSTMDTGIFKALQKASAEVLNSKEGDEYIAKSNLSYAKKQEIMLKGFKELGWDIDSLIVPTATFYLWLPIPPRYSNSTEFTQDVMKTSGVILVPGTAFGDYGEGFFRLSFVASDEDLVQVIERMKKDGFYFN